ncbi:restriction endonuclease subunit S [Listeria marthii]|uniref:restriction endonuclease subunit S n=1 Tax=Listeria marthii TaxID=529731 RepID=UPI0016280921|nr:restriction endonuclease subunit S [Listeria marthii]
MKKLEKSVPIIRFKGFYEAWEQRKLGEVTESFDGKRVPIDSGLRISGEYPYYGATGIIDYVDDYIFDGEYVLLAEDGANITMRNYPVAYLTQGKFWLNNHAHIMRMIDGSNYFLVQVLEKIDYMKYNTGTAQPKLNSKVVKNIEFKLPHVEEQRKIGTFFKQLDDTIALHQRKLDALKLMKKGFLQQMFPNNEEKVPRLRFADFNEKWERCKISSFARNTYGGGTPKTNVPEYWQGRIPWIQSGDLLIDSLFNIIPKKHVTGSAVKSSATKCIPANSIAIVTRVGVGKLAFIPFEYTTSQDFLSLSNLRVDSNFGTYSIYIMLQRELNNIQGSTIKGITKSDLLEKNINKPLNRIEQERIGVSLKLLDNIITLHQSKLEKLSSLKKVYLQRMFI